VKVLTIMLSPPNARPSVFRRPPLKPALSLTEGDMLAMAAGSANTCAPSWSATVIMEKSGRWLISKSKCSLDPRIGALGWLSANAVIVGGSSSSVTAV
jgi:hypothetical protein